MSTMLSLLALLGSGVTVGAPAVKQGRKERSVQIQPSPDLVVATVCRHQCSRYCASLDPSVCKCLYRCAVKHAALQDHHVAREDTDADVSSVCDAAVCDRSGKRAFPTVLILGTQKGGTTSMFRDLVTGGNGTFMAPVIPEARKDVDPSYFTKELHFFNDKGHFDLGPDHYSSYFGTCRSIRDRCVIPIEGTPNYFMSTAENHADESWVRAGEFFNTHMSAEDRSRLTFVVIVRDPAERYISAYNHFCVRDHGTGEYCDNVLSSAKISVTNPECQFKWNMVNFGTCAAYFLKSGIYWLPLSGWVSTFPEARFVVTTYSQYVANPNSVLNEIASGFDMPPIHIEEAKFAANIGEYDEAGQAQRDAATTILNHYYARHSSYFWQLLEAFRADPRRRVTFVGTHGKF
eukprot:m.209829 g.209829  ORF g.209829 m.209829 type:complete len:404 (-) comp24748_c0_seq1:78-1289(-)